ncbi:hypothetical protein MMC34_008763, partial [Xylographa carneopallida]|nr:hypothetical protein [Xylographa carneopallida]
MFNEPSRRVNLAGRNSASLHSNRSTLLEQSRRERDARQLQKQQQSAAVRIQSFIRAQQHVKRRKEEQRQLFDALLPRTVAQYKQPQSAPSSALSDLVLCIRQLLFFYSARTASDRQRWVAVQQLLTVSLREPQPSPLQPADLSSSRHYSALLLLSSAHNATWLYQVSRLAALLLADITAVDTNETSVAGAVLLLFQLFSAQQWSVYPAAKTSALFAPLLSAAPSSSLSSLQQTIAAGQLHVLSQLVYVQPALVFRHPRARFGHTPASVSWHAALRARLLHLTKLGAASAVSTATKNAVGLLVLLSAVPLQLQQASIETVSPTFASSFVALFLSIPLLSARLQALGLSAILQRTIDPTVVSAALQQRLHLASCLSVLPASRSYSTWDDEAKALVPAAMEVDDDESDSDSRDDRPDPGLASSATLSAAAVPTSPASLWLLGNLLDWHTQLFTDKADGTAQQRLSVYLSVLEELVVDVPSTAFPSKRTIVHPVLLSQLSILYSRSFLDRIISRLHTAQQDVQQASSSTSTAAHASPSSSLRDVVTICVLIDTLLFKWNESRDILNALSFSTNLIRFLWDTLTDTGTVTAVLTTSASSTSLASSTAAKAAVDVWSASSLVSSVVPLFCSCYAHLLPVLSDAEFFGDETGSAASAGVAEARSLLPVKADAGTPIPAVQQSELVRFLVALSYRLYW